jgi:hypothetical protein
LSYSGHTYFQSWQKKDYNTKKKIFLKIIKEGIKDKEFYADFKSGEKVENFLPKKVKTQKIFYS